MLTPQQKAERYDAIQGYLSYDGQRKGLGTIEAAQIIFGGGRRWFGKKGKFRFFLWREAFWTVVALHRAAEKLHKWATDKYKDAS